MAESPISPSIDNGAGSPMVTHIETSGDYDMNRRVSNLPQAPTRDNTYAELSALPESKENSETTVSGDDPKSSGSTHCGLPRKRFWICIVAAISIAASIAIIVGCVIGLRGDGSNKTR